MRPAVNTTIISSPGTWTSCIWGYCEMSATVQTGPARPAHKVDSQGLIWPGECSCPTPLGPSTAAIEPLIDWQACGSRSPARNLGHAAGFQHVFTDPLRTSPTAKTPGRLDSINTGGRWSGQLSGGRPDRQQVGPGNHEFPPVTLDVAGSH